MNFLSALLAGFGGLMASGFGNHFRTEGEPMFGYLFNLFAVIYFLTCFYYIFQIHNARIERAKARITENPKKIR